QRRRRRRRARLRSAGHPRSRLTRSATNPAPPGDVPFRHGPGRMEGIGFDSREGAKAQRCSISSESISLSNFGTDPQVAGRPAAQKNIFAPLRLRVRSNSDTRAVSKVNAFWFTPRRGGPFFQFGQNLSVRVEHSRDTQARRGAYAPARLRNAALPP